jgi:hypothetical protein
MQKAPPHKEVARRVVELMRSPKFRTQFMVRVPILHAVNGVRYLPLLPPEYCEPRYRRFVARHITGENNHAAYFHMPDCRKPPYKRPSFYGRVRAKYEG